MKPIVSPNPGNSDQIGNYHPAVPDLQQLQHLKHKQKHRQPTDQEENPWNTIPVEQQQFLQEDLPTSPTSHPCHHHCNVCGGEGGGGSMSE